MVCCRYLPLLLILLLASPLSANEIQPYASRNQSPLVQLFGLPPTPSPFLPAPGHSALGLSLDSASHFTQKRTGTEEIILDGESHRLALHWRHTLASGLEVAVEIPYLIFTGGDLDGFIDNWHDTFVLPQGGRDHAPRNQLLFRYRRDNRTVLELTQPNQGLGDIRLAAAWQLLGQPGARQPALALHGSLKLPSGDSDYLRGSGSTDGALSLAFGRYFSGGWGESALYGALGGVWLGKGEVLPDQQRHGVAFGSLGAGWNPYSWLDFKLQLDGHSACYGGSNLVQLAGDSLQLVMGGTLHFGPETSLDLAVSEDLVVDTAPDVVFHLALWRRF